MTADLTGPNGEVLVPESERTRCEVWTRIVAYYHPREDKHVTHDTFDEALCMACAQGFIAATPLPDALLSLTEVQLAACGHVDDPR